MHLSGNRPFQINFVTESSLNIFPFPLGLRYQSRDAAFEQCSGDGGLLLGNTSEMWYVSFQCDILGEDHC